MPIRFRIAVWNCNMRLHEKLDGLRLLRPDVIVLPECACPEVLLRRIPDLGATGIGWTGLRANKGLGVFSFGAWRLSIDASHDPRGATTLPLRVDGPASLAVLGVWAIPPWGRRSGGRRPEPLPRAIERHAAFLSHGPALIAGDFNNALVAARTDGRTQPSALFRRLAGWGFVSAAGDLFRPDESEASHPTYYRNRRAPKRVPSDVVFIGGFRPDAISSCEIGHPYPWIRASDHAPMAVNLRLPPAAADK